MVGQLILIGSNISMCPTRWLKLSRIGHWDPFGGKNVIYHQDLGYLILGLRILDHENFAAKYLFRILGSSILRIEDPKSSG